MAKKSINNEQKENFFFNFRLIICGFVATLGFIIIALHLAIIQFVQGEELSQKAYNQQIEAQIISPNRGKIFDAKGETLAQSIAVDTVSLNPELVTYSNRKKVEDEVIAKGMSEIFNVTYEKMMEELAKNKSVIVVEKKVEKDKINKLKKWMEENKITAGNVIIMNPQTGEILAMATNPDYDLNQPSNYEATVYNEEEWKALEAVDISSSLLNVWKNRAVSGTYEPGSTFKLITAAVGLEEGYVKTDTAGDFNCTGSYVVAIENDEPVPISCWRPQPHGSQTLRLALQNSCNPAFMQLGQRIGASTLYKYFKAFGLFEPIGGDIAKAYKGTFTALDDVGPVELATTSFGQRFEISPLQLVTAVSAICNDGKLVKPKVVKQVENTDTGSIEVVETEIVRQVISKETADNVKNMMLSVVTDGTGRSSRVAGYSIGGKSGTSEPRPDKKEEGYVASFIAASPIENTQVVVLFALYGLNENADHQGGQVAAPFVSQILSEILPYLGIESTENSETTQKIDDSLRTVPNVKNLTIAEARQQLGNLGFNVICNSDLDPNTTLIVDQVPKYGIGLNEGSVICLYTSNEDVRNKTTVPNVKDMTAKQAENALRSKNLNVQIDGTAGIVVSQDPTYETEVEEGTVVHIVIKETLTGSQLY